MNSTRPTGNSKAVRKGREAREGKAASFSFLCALGVLCGPQLVRSRRSRSTGFTLIEVLVALVILATLAGVLVISLPSFDQRRAEREAERFAALLVLACEQAELGGRELGVHLAQTGYGFSLADREGWLPYGGGHRFQERELAGISLRLPDAHLPGQLDFERAPEAVCWPGGELSALELRFVHGERELARVRTGADAAPVFERSDGEGGWRPRS